MDEKRSYHQIPGAGFLYVSISGARWNLAASEKETRFVLRLLTEKDIAEKPLEELQAVYEKDREEARCSARTRNGQKERRVICSV